LDLQQQTCVKPSAERSTVSQPASHPRLRIHRAFHSHHLPDARDLIVYLPPGYDLQQEKFYPVLYLHDGQNLFNCHTSYGRTWQVGEQADDAIEAGEVEPLIIVGIHNAGERRIAEYTHEPDANMGGGEAEAYGLLLTQELLPWIRAQYRVRTDPESTGLGGSSLGGLVSLFLGLRHPGHFGKLALLSPSVWWNHKSILGYLSQRAPQLRSQPRIWLDAGDREGQRTLQDAEDLDRCLRTNGWRSADTLHFECISGGTHDEASWSQRVRPMLRFLYPAQSSR